MSHRVEQPPQSIVWHVHSIAPGIWGWFLGNLIQGVTDAVTVTSWYRNELVNASVGGHVDSQHLAGLAIDFVTGDPGTVARLNASGLVAVDEGSHVHVQALRAGIARPAGLLTV